MLTQMMHFEEEIRRLDDEIEALQKKAGELREKANAILAGLKAEPSR
jgi:peptidoglycan hydrolase CwlO-like protein